MANCSFPACKREAAHGTYCYDHKRLMGVPSPVKEKSPIAKVSEKKKAQNAINTVEDAELQAAFMAFRKRMTGRCEHCGGKSCKDDNKYWKHSAAHIFPKALFPSIKSHPLNFIELCFWENSCHTNYDNGMIEPWELKCYPKMRKAFVTLYPLLTREEKKRVPECYLELLTNSTLTNDK